MAQPLRVALDARCLNTAHLRGMGKYVAEMLAHADGLDDIQWTLFGERAEAPFRIPSLRNARTVVFDVKGYRFNTWEQVGLPWRVSRASGAQVLHATATTLPWWQPVPTVVTLHDTLPWQHAATKGYERWYWWQLIPAALHRCAAVITISESSRRDIVALWPALADKLRVVPHGISDAYLNPVEADRPACVREAIGFAPYVLYVGGAAEHKRLVWALKVFEGSRKLDVRLLALGFSTEEIDGAQRHLPSALTERVRFLPFVAESEMPQLYRHAIATLYPTRYEGFGFPAIESQAVGTPVLFSAVGSLAELIGPHAIVLPLEDLAAWRSALSQVLRSRTEACRDTDSTRAWTAAYSWRKSAEQHLKIYRLAAGVSST